MQVGMVGLGRMGANLVRRLMRDDHECIVYDIDDSAMKALEAEGAIASSSLGDFIAKLSPPRTAWVMVPAAYVGSTVTALAEWMERGDVVIDGGNSYFRDDIERAKAVESKGLHFIDVGTSGGVAGLERGYCLMIGGDAEVVRRLDPIFATLAPGIEAAPRTPGREGGGGTAERGYLHCGPVGAGHFVKMVHNGIEYGVMAAYAEGLAILHRADVGLEERAADAETAPLRDPQQYRYEINTADVAEVWRRGSVIASWLLDLSAAALVKDPDLSGFTGRVSDSGEGRWTAIAAIDEGVPAHALTAALYGRFASRGEADFANRVQSAMRQEFGGHAEGAAP